MPEYINNSFTYRFYLKLYYYYENSLTASTLSSFMKVFRYSLIYKLIMSNINKEYNGHNSFFYMLISSILKKADAIAGRLNKIYKLAWNNCLIYRVLSSISKLNMGIYIGLFLIFYSIGLAFNSLLLTGEYSVLIPICAALSLAFIFIGEKLNKWLPESILYKFLLKEWALEWKNYLY